MDRVTEEFFASLHNRAKLLRQREGQSERELTRLSAAETYLAKADEAFTDSSNIAINRYRGGMEQLLFAAVELDELIYPEVDPNEGWVRWGPEKQFDSEIVQRMPVGYHLETQLQRLLFDRAGCLLSLAYKPRKADLTALFVEHGLAHRAPSFLFFDPARLSVAPQGSAVAPQGPAVSPLGSASSSPLAHSDVQPFILRNSKDAVEVRFDQQLSDTTKISKQLLVRAGLGAHLNYSTTGFRFEFWAEGAVPSSLGLEFNLLLPQATDKGFLVAPLESFGAVANSTDQPGILQHSPAQGCWGMQLTDALNDFVIQFRFSKPVISVEFQHQYTNPADDATYQGTKLTVILPGKHLQNSLQPLTLFFSIL